MSLKLQTLAAATALVGAVAASELSFRRERTAAGPVVLGTHHLAYEEHGAANAAAGKTPLVFVHGWPDDPRLFTPLCKRLSAERGYRCINVSLPAYGLPDDWTGVRERLPGGEREWGFDMNEVVELLHATIHRACGGAGARVTVVMHDWGCIFAYMLKLRYPDVVVRLVSADVGLPTQVRPAFAAFLLAYQTLLNVAWMLPAPLGYAVNYVVQLFGRRCAAPGSGAIGNHRNWPYRAVFRSVLTDPANAAAVSAMQPVDTPWLYVYGRDKPFFAQFHDDAFLRRVSKSSALSRAVAVPGHHWFVVSHLDRYAAEVAKFLDETEELVRRKLAQ